MKGMFIVTRKIDKKYLWNQLLRCVPKFYRPFFRGLMRYLRPWQRPYRAKSDPEILAMALYSYSVWLVHLIETFPYRASFPQRVVEFGPGGDVGVGLAALISGVEKYYAVDKTTPIPDLSEVNDKMLNALVELFTNRTEVVDKDAPRQMSPYLESNCFPDRIFSQQRLAACVNPSRLSKIRNSLSCKNDRTIEYFAPGSANIKSDSVDMIISEAVMEHVSNTMELYRTMYNWLKPGGIISHDIDFMSHALTDDWNGHWMYSTFQWRIIEGNLFPLLNREPCSNHLRAIEEVGFRVVKIKRMREVCDMMTRTKFHRKYKEMDAEDITTRSALILAIKPPD